MNDEFMIHFDSLCQIHCYQSMKNDHLKIFVYQIMRKKF